MEGHEQLILGIEISNPSSSDGGSVALARGTTAADMTLVAIEPLRPVSRHDDALMPAIAHLCRSAAIRPKDLGRVVISLGPGGYTSIRIAATAGKFICEAVGAVCVGVPTARALVQRIRTDVADGARATVCLAWKRNDVWCETFERKGTSWRHLAARLIAVDDAPTTESAVVVADADLAARLQHRPENTATIWEAPRFDASAVIEVSYEFEPVNPAELLPLYPREPEAVSKWRTMKAER